MGNLLQMSITSGQDTDSRQFTLAASSHRLAGETYDANGNRTSGSADGFTSVSYNILNLPETVTTGGRTINYLYSARWSTPDPLSEKYYSISPYAYCAGNPVNLVDPEGMDIWELQRDGRVIRKEKSDSNVLYAVDIHGNRGDSMVFSSEDILLQLEKKDNNKEIRSIDFSGKRKTDAIGLFLFLADNTSFEWAVHIGKDGTVVGTRYNDTNAGYWGDYGLTEVPILSIHSHPGEYGFKYGFYGETGDMEGDQQRMSKNPNAKADMYYIYYPGSKNTYQICKKDYEIKEVPKGLEKYRKRKI